MTALIVAILAGAVGFFVGRRIGQNEVKAELIPVMERQTDALEEVTDLLNSATKRERGGR